MQDGDHFNYQNYQEDGEQQLHGDSFEDYGDEIEEEYNRIVVDDRYEVLERFGDS